MINRTPTLVLDGKTPYSVFKGCDLTYGHLNVFGFLCYAQGRLGDKFDSPSKHCFFVEYPYRKNGLLFYDLETHEFFVSWDVKFYETEFPFAFPLSDNLVLPSNFGDPSIDFKDCDDLGVKGKQEGKLIMSTLVS